MDLMTNYKFDVMGSSRSIDNFLQGFSISFALGVIVVGSIGLAMRGERTELLKRVALVVALWLAAMTAVSLRYFFAAPTTFLVVDLLLFALAWIRLPSEGRVR